MPPLSRNVVSKVRSTAFTEWFGMGKLLDTLLLFFFHLPGLDDRFRLARIVSMCLLRRSSDATAASMSGLDSEF